MTRYSVRGGAELRKRVRAINAIKSAKHQCPVCGKKKVKRIGNAIWRCKSCETVFAGGAYSPTTLAGDSALRIVKG
ncbi:MAG: 50S ribosomal protein L37ae [Candidatus Micrarchaeia archaeon]